MMQAGLYAKQIVASLENNDLKHYNRLLGFADLECRILARYPRQWGALSIDKRMMKAFHKWEAIYRAVHSSLGNRTPPAPFSYSGPYLIVLNVLIADKNSDPYFSAKLLALRRHAEESHAARCDVFDSIYREHRFSNQKPLDAVEQTRVKNSMDKLFTKYIRCIGPFAIKMG